MPNDEEWQTLVDFAGDEDIGGTKLKAKSGWNTDSDYKLGTDDFDFSALPGGNGSSDGIFRGAGDYGCWWNNSENFSDGTYYRSMNYNSERVYYNKVIVKYDLFSVRCLKD